MRHLERARRLRARIDEEGVHRFDAAAVEALRGVVKPRRRSSEEEPASVEGAQASKAFALLDGGADWRELVRVLEVPPARARELAELHRAPGEVVLPPAVVAELAQLGAADAAGAVTARSVLACARRRVEQIRELRRGAAPAAQQPPV